MLTVHHVDWLTDQPVGKIARTLMDRGFTFDYISDAQLGSTRVEQRRPRHAGRALPRPSSCLPRAACPSPPWRNSSPSPAAAPP
jgi:hypothetical protein